MLGKKMSARQIGELHAREFFGDEVWIAWKMDYDAMMAYRKTIKGKPDEAQAIILKMNADWIEFYGSVLFHSARLAASNMCTCTRCGQKRSAGT